MSKHVSTAAERRKKAAFKQGGRMIVAKLSLG